MGAPPVAGAAAEGGGVTFTKQDDHHTISECKRYVINAAGERERVYMAVRLGRPSQILGTWRGTDAESRRDAYNAAVQACQRHAAIYR